MSEPFELCLFSVDPGVIQPAVAAGVSTIVVDWEHVGKRDRQQGANTEINEQTLDDLIRVRQSTNAIVVCRINLDPVATPLDVEQAIAGGADEILLPMVRRVDEVTTVLQQVAGRCRVGILIETRDAAACAAALATLPLSRIYVGLNDLAIERGTSNLFLPVVDGLLDSIRSRCNSVGGGNVRFGFCGLTLPECGTPISCQLLIGELTRLACDFTFLRRSYHRDMQGRDPVIEIPRILQAVASSARRTEFECAADRRALHDAIRSASNFSNGVPRAA